MITQNTLSFLKELRHNNNRDWFETNKSVFEKQQKETKIFFNEIGQELSKIDSIEKTKIFRIYRDVRFAKDKSPYKTNFGVTYSRTKPMLRGGYYLHIEPEGSFIAGGFWEPNKEDLLRIRKEIELDANELRGIISTNEFKKYFGELTGEEVKTAPKGFDKNHPNIDLIKKKQYLLIRKFTDKEVLAPNFKDEVIVTFKAMYPYFNYMSAVLTTNLNGEPLY
jgi:uncharacterized protein (TIGR02453 family)